MKTDAEISSIANQVIDFAIQYPDDMQRILDLANNLSGSDLADQLALARKLSERWRLTPYVKEILEFRCARATAGQDEATVVSLYLGVTVAHYLDEYHQCATELETSRPTFTEFEDWLRRKFPERFPRGL